MVDTWMVLVAGGWLAGWYVTAVGLARRANAWTYICSPDCKRAFYGRDVSHDRRCVRRLQPIKVPQSCALALIFPFVWLYAAVIWGAKAGTRRAVDHEWIEQQEKKYGIGG